MPAWGLSVPKILLVRVWPFPLQLFSLSLHCLKAPILPFLREQHHPGSSMHTHRHTHVNTHSVSLSCTQLPHVLMCTHTCAHPPVHHTHVHSAAVHLQSTACPRQHCPALLLPVVGWKPGSQIIPVFLSSPTGHTDDIFYSISSGDPHGYFSIDSDTGQLHTSLPLDHESQAVLILDVQARSGSPPAYSNTRVKISVSDVNDNAPMFPSPSDSILLPEATEPGTTVYTLQAEDRDNGANGQVNFELVSGGDGTFSVERSSGAVRLVGVLQYEASAAYRLSIVARDSGVPQLSSTFTLLVHVQAEHDNGPIFDTLTYRVEVREGVPVSTRFLQVRALARDAEDVTLTYHLRADGDAASFGIMSESGWLYVKSALDRETRDLYVLTVLASAGGSGSGGEARKTGTSTVRISITDENDNSPRLSEERYFFTVPENQAPGSSVGRVMASDRDAGQNSRLTYRLLQHDSNFLIHTQTGESPPAFLG